MPWIKVAAASELPPGACGEYVAGEWIVAVFNVGGTLHALDGICPHQGGPLGKGVLSGSTITCPWHGFQFDVATGQHLTSSQLIQPRVPVKVEAGEVYVEVE